MPRNIALSCVLVLLCSLVPSWTTNPISGVASAAESAKTLTRRAVVAGMMGQSDRRADLLAEAIEQDPNEATANWALGRVYVNDAWLPLDDYEQQMQQNSLLAKYQQQRDRLNKGQLTEMQLASWCRENRLFDRERLHWTNVWQSESTPPVARQAAAQRLGMQQVGGIWMTPAEAREVQQTIQTAQQDAAVWLPKTQTLIESLRLKDSERRRFAIQHYQQGLDDAAILSLENLLSTQGEAYALLAVQLIGKLPDYEATQSLARHAIYAETKKTREAAVEQLRTRSRQDTLPLLLSCLSNPLETAFGVSVGSDGMVRRTQLVYEQGREADVRYVNAATRGIHPVNRVELRVDGRGRLTGVRNTDDLIIERQLDRFESAEEQRAAESVLRMRFALMRQQLIRQEVSRCVGFHRSLQARNQLASEINERAMTALETITEETVEPATPAGWWDWWNEENGRYQGEKPTYTRYAEGSDPMQYSLARQPRSCECFPAGTLVRTQTGFREIESVQAGDQVLSQDTESGELGYKLVLGTTLRPPSAMVTIQLDEGLVEATRGHLFWVEEQGWKMAKNLKPNDLIHGLDTSRRVVSVASKPDTAAHNLIVADFGTYFVGKEQILVHDNSERPRTSTISPGIPKVTR